MGLYRKVCGQLRCHGLLQLQQQIHVQPRTQDFSSLGEKTLVAAGHVAPRFWVLNQNIAVGWVAEERTYVMGKFL